MGGMGRQFDGGYAQFICVPAQNVVKVETQLPWDVLGALPEMLQTAWGSLFSSLGVQQRTTLAGAWAETPLPQAQIQQLASHGALPRPLAGSPKPIVSMR